MRGQIASVIKTKELNVNENVKSKIKMRGNIIDIIKTNISENEYEDINNNQIQQNKIEMKSNIEPKLELNTSVNMISKIKMRGNIFDNIQSNVSEELYEDSDDDNVSNNEINLGLNINNMNKDVKNANQMKSKIKMRGNICDNIQSNVSDGDDINIDKEMIVVSSEKELIDEYKKRITNIYKLYNPEKINKVDVWLKNLS